ncbi:PstS family phosphate ABC transporter substrate-binding protein [Candidatus Sodalis sp. SoCistrobi]|uniref:PstS family phosphate ABC transporter substrate-binding protein n=1 Tax=Candidatus Sodalis sp. SoCistrobi TaxID=1922216 RepID=UPI0009398404|nr:substrate-binding domain-containing protein [Candidatus Sodalis sp. SoCistrobi]
MPTQPVSPSLQPVSPPAVLLSGTLTSTGSDTLSALMSGWAAAFSRHYPGVGVQLQATGSAAAAAALVAGTAELGPMSRPMSEPEIEGFRRRYGYPPLALPVAQDALVVMVNQANPLQAISQRQLDAIFSVTRQCGQAAPIRYWGTLGLPGEWRSLALLRYGRNTASGTQGFFRHRVLCGGDMQPTVNELPGSAAVARAVAASVNAIGYTSMGFHASGVKWLAISDAAGHTYSADAQTLRRGDYPFTRPLYIYVNKPPGKPLDPLTLAFLARVLSPEGQEQVGQAGYIPLTPSQRLAAQRAAGLL